MNTPEDEPEETIKGINAADLLARGLESAKTATGNPQAWQPPTPEELSKLLPQYEIEALLGRGGMGAVYRGRQAALDRPVAIKLLPAELAADAEFMTRFQREARTLAKLQHPGIVAVHDFGQTSEGHLYFVMEFVNGTDLARLIHGPGINPAQALEVIAQVCEALQYAHSQGVIHRDIKPANVLINQEGRAKLADFGLARPTSEETASLTRSNVVMGTPDYMAPEQMAGTADHRADLYALGVMLYEMLTGQTPRGAWAPPSQRVQVDVRLDQVVVRALQQDPAMRYQQASEIKTDVDVIRTTPLPKAGKAKVRLASEAPGQRTTPLPKVKKPGNKFALAVAIVLLLGFVGFFLSQRTKPNGAASGRALTKQRPPSGSPAWQPASMSPTEAKQAAANNGWVTQPRWYVSNIGTGQFTDGAVHMRYRWTKNGQFSIVLRETTEGRVQLWIHGDGRILLESWQKDSAYSSANPKRTALKVNPFETGREGRIELAVIGGSAYALVDEHRLRLDDLPSKQSGQLILQNGYMESPASVRDVEVAILDGIPDPLKALGWDNTESTEQREIDLLAMIDPSKDSAQMSDSPNQWAFTSGALHYLSAGRPGQIGVPLEIRSNHYQMEVAFDADFPPFPQTGTSRIHFFLPTEKEGFHWAVRVQGDGTLRIGPLNSSQIHLRWSDQPASSGRVGVNWDIRDPKKARLEVLRDGQVVDRWEGDPAPFVGGILNPHSELGLRSLPALFSSGPKATFKSFKLTLFEGEAQTLRGAGQTYRAASLNADASAGETPGGEWQDLLALIDINRNAKSGPVKRNGAGIEFPESKAPNLVEIPYVAPPEYDIEAEFTPTRYGNNVNLHLSAAGHSFAWKINAHSNNSTICGFELFDGLKTNQRSEAMSSKGPILEVGKRYRTRVEVRKNSLRGFVDDQLLVEWTGDFARLSPESHSHLSDPRHLGLGSWSRPVIFHTAKLREWRPDQPTGAALENHWHDFMAEIADGPHKNVQLGKVWQRDAGGWRVGQFHVFMLPDEAGRDLALRVTGAMAPGKGPAGTPGNLTLHLRQQPEKSGYTAILFNTGHANIRLGAKDLKGFALGSSFDPAAKHSLELRAQDDLLTLLVDDVELGAVRDSTLPAGGLFGVGASEGSRVEKVEYRFLSDAPTAVLSPDALEFKGHRYQFVAAQMPWSEAKAQAEKMGGHLVTFADVEELNWVSEQVAKPKFTVATEQVWTGASKASAAEPWQWVTGEAWNNELPIKGNVGTDPRNGGYPAYAKLLFYSGMIQLFDASDTAQGGAHWQKENIGFIIEWDTLMLQPAVKK